jgi:hypothetical protein
LIEQPTSNLKGATISSEVFVKRKIVDQQESPRDCNSPLDDQLFSHCHSFVIIRGQRISAGILAKLRQVRYSL